MTVLFCTLPAMYDNGVVATLTLNFLHFPDYLTDTNSVFWNFVFGPREKIEMPDVSGFSALHSQKTYYKVAYNSTVYL